MKIIWEGAPQTSVALVCIQGRLQDEPAPRKLVSCNLDRLQKKVWWNENSSHSQDKTTTCMLNCWTVAKISVIGRIARQSGPHAVGPDLTLAITQLWTKTTTPAIKPSSQEGPSVYWMGFSRWSIWWVCCARDELSTSEWRAPRCPKVSSMRTEISCQHTKVLNHI